jgi:predicted nucleic acid-binding protein
MEGQEGVILVVSDTSPIRALAHLGLIEVLKSLYPTVLIPPAVARELKEAGIDNIISKYFFVQSPTNLELVEQLKLRLDEGESEAIALALDVKADFLLIDERHGRNVAAELGVRHSGVVAVLIEARQAKLISSVRECLDKLRNELNFFLGDDVVRIALKAAGEIG